MKVKLLRQKQDVKPKFEVGDIIRRKPLASYNYEQPVHKIVAIKSNLYVFEQKPLALEIFAQDEWELQSTRRSRVWWYIKEFFKRLFRYHQPKKLPWKRIGQQKKRPGLTLFQYNKATGEISVAPVVDNKCFVVDSNCVYHQALNSKSFVKYLKKKGMIGDKDEITLC